MEAALEDRLGQYVTLQKDCKKNDEPFCIVWRLGNRKRVELQVYDLYPFWHENKVTADGIPLYLGSNLDKLQLDGLKEEGKLVAVLINSPEDITDFATRPPDCLLYQEYKKWDGETETFTDLKTPLTREIKNSCVIGCNQALYLGK